MFTNSMATNMAPRRISPGIDVNKMPKELLSSWRWVGGAASSGHGGDDVSGGVQDSRQLVGSNIPALSVAIVIAIVLFVFIVLCIYYSYIAYPTQSQDQTTTHHFQEPSSVQQHPEKTTKLSRKERKAQLLAYFDRSGNQMEVNDSHLVPMNAAADNIKDRDIERGRNYNERQGTMMESAGAVSHDGDGDDDYGNGMILLVPHRRIVVQPTISTEKTLIHFQNRTGDSYNNNNVVATLESHDGPCNDACASLQTCNNNNNNNSHPPSHGDIHTDTNNFDYPQHKVTDACVICFESYGVGETVVWSTTCPHVFHKECLMEYLLSHRGNGTPCPSCRQTYCDESVFCLSTSDRKGGNE